MANRFDSNADKWRRTTSLPSSSTMSWAGWFYITTDQNVVTPFFYRTANSAPPYVYVGTDSDGTTVLISVGDDGPSTVNVNGTNLATATWHHIAYTVASGVHKVYLNGTLDATATPGHALTPTNDEITFGHDDDPDNDFLNGRIGPLKIWDGVALTAAEIQKEMWSITPQRTASLYGWYPFNHVDFGGSGRDFTASGTIGTEDGPPVGWTNGLPLTRRPAAVTSSDVAISPTITFDAVGKSLAAATVAISPTITFDAVGKGLAAATVAISPTLTVGMTGKSNAAATVAISPTLTVDMTLATPRASYTTTFSSNETTISESGLWANQGLDWTTIDVSGGLAVGTQDNDGGFDDSYAHLTGMWPADQEISGVIHKGSTSGLMEIELHLRATDYPHSMKLYECNLAHNGAYQDIIRWNGPLGTSVDDFTFLVPTGTFTVASVNDGDVFKARIVGNIITTYIAAAATPTTFVQVGTVDITSQGGETYRGGNPGIGYYRSGGTAFSNYAFTSITATGSGSDVAISPTLTVDMTGKALSAGTVAISPTLTVGMVGASQAAATVAISPTVTFDAVGQSTAAATVAITPTLTVAINSPGGSSDVAISPTITVDMAGASLAAATVAISPTITVGITGVGAAQATVAISPTITFDATGKSNAASNLTMSPLITIAMESQPGGLGGNSSFWRPGYGVGSQIWHPDYRPPYS